MLRLLVLLLQLLRLPALAPEPEPEPAAQDVSLGVVSAESPGSRDLQGLGEREASARHLGQADG